MIWFTSDWHFFHDRILDFHPKRKELFGNTVEEATEKMILLWNNTIDKKDTVYILGDLAFGTVEQKRKLFQRLHGNKVLILGNHDKVPDELKCYFNHITQIKNIKFKKSTYIFLPRDLETIMCHFPLFSWEHDYKGAIMLHGHSHGKVDKDDEQCEKFRIDVGLDSTISEYRPVSLEKIAKLVEKHDKKQKSKECNLDTN